MKRLLPALAVLSLTAASLAACASAPTVYQAATPSNPIGYSEYRIEPGRYRITFQGGASATPQQVTDLALLRAADLAIADGYDWFQVADRFVRPTSSGSSGPRVSFGVGGASFGSHSSVGMGVGTGFDLGGGSSYGSPAATIEVLMGKGPKPERVDAYDARALRQSLGHPA
jgi:hypothetical protein